jgi:hypothetical protein
MHRVNRIWDQIEVSCEPDRIYSFTRKISLHVERPECVLRRVEKIDSGARPPVLGVAPNYSANLFINLVYISSLLNHSAVRKELVCQIAAGVFVCQMTAQAVIVALRNDVGFSGLRWW